MIDIHAHILPKVDDGAVSWAESLAMAELAVKSGVTAVVATPHVVLPSANAEERVAEIGEKLARFQGELTEAGIPLAVYPGMEIFGTEETAWGLENGLLTTLNGSRYPLIEFPFEGYARQATRILDEVLEAGFRPVVAHPERYRYVQLDPTLLNLWTDMGCLLQVNRGSVMGRFGPAAQELGLSMVSRGFACAVASDAHASQWRTPWMSDVRALLEEEFSAETAGLLLRERPGRILENKAISIPEPVWF